jgi:hypothetical protein
MEQNSMPIARPWRVAAVFLPGLVIGLYFILSTGPIPQPLSYHDFADTHVWLGIAHAGDVLTNLAFVVAGGWGLWSLMRPTQKCGTFTDARERWLFQWFFIGVLLTGLGSGWYHLAPDNNSLVWDRAPMAIGFMSIVAIMLAERVKVSLGVTLLFPLMAIGVGTVFWWIWTEHAGNGDLRPYLFVQFYPMVTIVLMLLLLPAPYTHSNHYWGLFVFYAAAKIFELLDHRIFEFTDGLVTGHNLKHLFAAGGAAWILRMLWLRQPRARAPKQSATAAESGGSRT